jgi:peptidoglycan-associated lipoprotein
MRGRKNNIYVGIFKEEKMRRLLVLLLLASLPFVFFGCGGGTQPPPEPEEQVQPVQEPEPEPEPEPQPKPEPVIKKITDSDFKIAYFDFDKYNLVDSAKAALEYNAKILKENPNLIVRIAGHCDERGTVEYNLSLGESRALSAMDYLISLGIDKSRLSIISYGKERPAVMGHNEAAWAKNRRDEFTVISQ